MPWVRIDENAIDHPKFLAISANAWRLWCEGGTYCQKHLTDGLIPRSALKGFRYYSPAAMKQLTAVLVPGKGPLWHQGPDGIQVHDYLEWNDSRDEVMRSRSQAKDRKRRFAEKNASENASGTPSQTANVSSGVVCSLELASSSTEKGEGGLGETTPSRRAGQFCQWYEDTHQRLFRVGYMGTRSDYETALRLVAKFTDAELKDAALVWFGQDDEFAAKGTRTIPKFASRASDCVLQARRVPA